MGSAVNEDDLRVDKLSLVQNGEVSGHENVSTRRLVLERTCVSNEDVDPQYKLFLENLKRYGGSYALEVVGDDGVSELIRYHQEDGLARRVVRRRVSDEDVDPQYELFLESLREDGNSYAFEVDREDGVSEVIRYHKDGFQRRIKIKRRCISDEDVDPQCKLFLENLREDGNSYALKVSCESRSSELISYHQENGLGKGVKRRSVCNEKLENLMLVDYCEKNLSLLMHGDGEEHSGDDSSEIRSVDDSYNEHGFSSDDYSGVRSVEYDDSGNEQSGVNNTDVTSVHDGDNWNEQSSDGDSHVKSLDDNVNDIKSKLFLESLREVENTCAQEIVQETGIPDLFQNPRSVATEPIKNLLVEDMTDTEHRETLEILKDLPKRKSSVVKKNAELVAQDPASGMENGLSSKIPRLEVPKNPQELNSDTPGTLENLQVKGENVDNRVLKLFEKLREKKSSVEKNEAKLEILNPISSRTRGNSSKRPHLKARNTPESFTSSPLKEKMETKGTLRRMKKEVVKINRPNKSTHLLNEEEAERLKTSGNKRSEYPYTKRTNELPNKKPGSEVHHFANCGRNGFAKFDRIGDDETESNQTDESYQDFISVLEINDENMIYVPQDGRPETYDVEIKDEDAESSSDSDLVVLERDPVDRCRTPIKKDSNNDLESHTNFREGLMKDLKRPYDENEYIRLLMEWTNQRPAGGHAKNFRSGVVKTYALKGEYGKPYMDLYQDLAEIIKLSDRPRRLSLLRGFFYWLKNVAQDKSFEPWTDIECLNVVPQL